MNYVYQSNIEHKGNFSDHADFYNSSSILRNVIENYFRITSYSSLVYLPSVLKSREHISGNSYTVKHLILLIPKEKEKCASL